MQRILPDPSWENCRRNRPSTESVYRTLAGTFIYCLLVLRTVRDSADDEFVPKIAVTFGIVLVRIWRSDSRRFFKNSALPPEV
jgi:hypothetical protein